MVKLEKKNNYKNCLEKGKFSNILVDRIVSVLCFGVFNVVFKYNYYTKMNVSVIILKLFTKKTSEAHRTYISFFTLIIFIFLVKIISFRVNSDSLDYANSNFEVLGLNLPANLSFAGEKVPLNDFEIKESLEKEFFGNKSWKSSSLVLFNKDMSTELLDNTYTLGRVLGKSNLATVRVATY